MPQTYMPPGWGRSGDVVPPHILDKNRNRLARTAQASFCPPVTCNPNPTPSASARIADGTGRALVAHRENVLRASLSWEAGGAGDATATSGLGTVTKRHSELNNASNMQSIRGALVPTVSDPASGKRHQSHSPAKLPRGTGKTTSDRRYSTHILYGSCTMVKADARQRPSHRARGTSPSKDSQIHVQNGTVTHTGSPTHKGRAKGAGAIDPSVGGNLGARSAHGRPTNFVLDVNDGCYLDKASRKGRSMSPRKDTSQLLVTRVDLATPSQSVETVRAKQRMIAEMRKGAYKQAPAGVATPHDTVSTGGGADARTTGKRRITYDTVRSYSPDKFVSTYSPRPMRTDSPSKRVSITGSPKRQLGPSHQCTRRLLAWD